VNTGAVGVERKDSEQVRVAQFIEESLQLLWEVLGVFAPGARIPRRSDRLHEFWRQGTQRSAKPRREVCWK